MDRPAQPFHDLRDLPAVAADKWGEKVLFEQGENRGSARANRVNEPHTAPDRPPGAWLRAPNAPPPVVRTGIPRHHTPPRIARNRSARVRRRTRGFRETPSAPT